MQDLFVYNDESISSEEVYNLNLKDIKDLDDAIKKSSEQLEEMFNSFLM